MPNPMPSIEQFKKEDGDIDWAALRRAEIASGHRCSKCESYSIISAPPEPRSKLCHSCQSIVTDAKEVRHSNLIRCPKCRKQMDAGYVWEHGVDFYAEEAEVRCDECDEEFTVGINTSITYTSPALLKEAEEEDEE